MCVQFIVKYLLFFFNLFFWLAGVALIALGIAVLVNLSPILNLIPVDLNGIPIGVIVAGSIIFIIAFSGCYGAITESRCWLILYAVFMLILAACCSYLAYVVLGHLDTLPDTVMGWVDEAFQVNVVNNNFHVFETTFDCCGSTGADSYLTLGRPIPPTCCPEPEDGVCTTEVSYKGCATRLGDYLEYYGQAVGYVIIVIIVVQVIAMLLAFYLNSVITRKNQRSY